VVVGKLRPESRCGPSRLGPAARRLFTAQSLKDLRALEAAAAARDPRFSPPGLASFFRVECASGTDPEALACELRARDDVLLAYVDSPDGGPQVGEAVVEDHSWHAMQGYLHPAPVGVDAEHAWVHRGGDGAGQRLIDVERGWTLNHRALAAHKPRLLHGRMFAACRDHGTSALGVVCGLDPAIGHRGIAPNLARVDVVSFHRSHRANAILAALAHLDPGDVLLIEGQVLGHGRWWAPFEVLEAEYAVIRLATALGIIVVEAGGNGDTVGEGLDLDQYLDDCGRPILRREPANAAFRDSGAILVSAGTSRVPHRRMPWAPFGSRVDCYAWGARVVTAGSDARGDRGRYCANFDGTSAAAAIVAGTVLAVQGIAQARLGRRLSPLEMRALLSDPALGTPPAKDEDKPIGVMPDLRRIIAKLLG
jgi:hypothetical protein